MSDQQFLTQDEWRKVVKRCLGTSQFQVLDCKLKRLSEGGGFLGEHRLAKLKVQLHDADRSQQILNFFIKGQPEALEIQKELVEQTGTFKKEVEILKLFVELRSILNNGGEGMEWCCKCFYTRLDVIVFEDVTVQGFRVVNSRIESRWQHCATILKALANLHSASFIFEEKQPTQPYSLGKKYADVLWESMFIDKPGHPGVQMVEVGIEVVWRLVEEIHGADTLRRTKTQIKETIMSLFELVKTSDRFRNCVSHGDLWRNNMFFRHEEDEPVEARLCDFQLTRYTPPAVDVTCFLYITTSRSFRGKFLSQLLVYYYDQLSENLKRHDLDPDHVLPWKEFKESCDFYKKLGVVFCSLYQPFALMNADDYKQVFESSKEYERFMKFDRRPEATHSFKNDSYYRQKITEVIDELIEVCVEKK